jgi:hypothetical protein
MKHVGRISDKLPNTKARQSRARSIRKTWWNTKDLRLLDAPATLLAPGVAKALKVKMNWTRWDYAIWGNTQALRYLMRAAQPWFADILNHELRTKLKFPWTGVPRVAAIHLRGGDKRKEWELWRILQCRKIFLEAYVNVIESELDTRTIVASSDVDDILTEFKKKFGDATYMHTTFAKPNQAGLDSRDLAAKMFGKFYVTLVAFLDLLVAVSADSWVFYESNWSKLIDRLRETSGRYSCPTIDIARRAKNNMTFRAKYCDTQKPTEWVDESQSLWGWAPPMKK